MKPQASSLNPYAASYIPLSKREGGGSKNYGGTVWSLAPQHTTKDQQLIDPSTVKNQPASSSYISSSQNVKVIEKQLEDEEVEMDIEFLRMQFPGISDQSLLDVYNVNNGDLDAALEMLTQLEFVGNLPETLDIGDVSESGLSADSASSSQKKDVAAEASTSSGHMASANV